MNENIAGEAGAARAGHLRQKIAELLEAGRLSADEAAALRSDVAEGRLDEVINVIRTKHAEPALARAVSQGHLTRQQADDYLQRLRDGDHSAALRAELRQFRR